MLTFVCSLALIASVPMADVNVFVGTDGVGHTTPAAACPFGLVQAGPDTGNGSWDYCSGYQFRDRTLIGFSQTHLSGTGAADFGDVRLLPYVGEECPKCVGFARHAVARDERRRYFGLVPLRFRAKQGEERVFPGVHSDVGGLYEDNHDMADAALTWIGEEAVARGLKLKAGRDFRRGLPGRSTH